MEFLGSQMVLCCVFLLFLTGSLAQDVGTIVTSDLFNEMLKNRNDDRCPAKGFYTYDAFIAAANSFPGFGTTGDSLRFVVLELRVSRKQPLYLHEWDLTGHVVVVVVGTTGDDTARKKEIAAFFGQTSHETTEKMNGRPLLFWSSWNNKVMGIQLTIQLLVALITAVLVITTLSLSRAIRPKEIGEKIQLNSLSRCNFFSGKWVFDNQSRPLYNGSNCSFISFLDDGMACQNYGRKDLDYLYWKWQPNDCDLPRFNATAMLSKLRNKRLVYVGDSLNRNQWVSLVCMLESSIHTHLKQVHFNGSLVTLKAIEYNATIDFYWAPLLVESNCDDAWHHRVKDRVLRVDSIEKHARFWEDADVLVFNSYLWWRLDLTVLWGSFESADAKYEQLGMVRTYELGLQTWADWLDTHVNRTKTRVFFVSMSPTHSRGEEWGKAEGENCYNETEPISNAEYWGSESSPGMMRLVEAAIKKLNEKSGVKADLLNITQLSEYRKEAHPSIYRKHWDPLTKEQLENPSSYADCTHWCLPGVPDVWNHFLYVYLLYL